MITYRTDIDGLRAVSIIAVLLFHVGFDGWSGGYVGVDVFFVISGFLITSLIAADIDKGTFSLGRFYERRIRRLLPATIPVIAFTALFATAFYTSDRFLEYGQSLIAFTTYTSNWFFYATRGYFAGADATTPLLHTWSLAVEEQFYLFFPLLLLVLAGRPGVRLWVLSGVAVVSLVYAQFLLRDGQTDLAFYSSLTRIWELLAGALLALSPAVAKRLAHYSTVLRVVGLSLILGPVLTYGPATAFPGAAALPPVAGTLLLLAASPARRDPILSFLQAAPAVYTGRISYSLYLWHWPIIGALNVVVFDPNDLTKVFAIILSFLAAALSYHAVEMPFRRHTTIAGRQALAGLLAATTAASLTFGGLVWRSGGWPGRFPAGAENMAAVASQHIPDPGLCFVTGAQPNRFCHAADGRPLDIVLMGDSHAQSLVPAVRQFAQEQGLTAGFALRADCAPLVGVWRGKDVQQLCPQFAEEAMAFLAQTKPRIVILAARWSVYTVTGRQLFSDRDRVANDRTTSLAIFEDGLDRTLRRIAETGALPVVVEQMPENAGDLPSSSLVLMRLGLPLDTVAARKSKHQKMQRTMSDMLQRAAAKSPLVRIDPTIAFCPAERCTVEAGGRLFYSDNDHLNVAGSLFFLPYLSEELRKALAQRPRS